jgi:hypothetical protein
MNPSRNTFSVIVGKTNRIQKKMKEVGKSIISEAFAVEESRGLAIADKKRGQGQVLLLYDGNIIQASI